jgi:hypothetical protein
MQREFEIAYLKSSLVGLLRPKVPVLSYAPSQRQVPSRRLEGRPSAWKGLDEILLDIIQRFNLRTDSCLEFGVEHGFSTVALSSFFSSVTGVDTFQGDRHTANLKDIYAETQASVAPYGNIHLIKSDYQNFIKTADQSKKYDLIHVDIIHTFADTFDCGLWSANHSTCTIFHDTESFPAVKQAVREVARATGKKFYNFTECFGLGIVA